MLIVPVSLIQLSIEPLDHKNSLRRLSRIVQYVERSLRDTYRSRPFAPATWSDCRTIDHGGASTDGR